MRGLHLKDLKIIYTFQKELALSGEFIYLKKREGTCLHSLVSTVKSHTSVYIFLDDCEEKNIFFEQI